jgi:hypothetical protein
MRKTSTILAVAAALLAAPAAAHESAERAMGVVESVTPERLVVKAADGHGVAFVITGETRFFKGEKPASAADVRAGQRAVVHGRKAGDEVHALRVKLAPAPPARKPKAER